MSLQRPHHALPSRLSYVPIAALVLLLSGCEKAEITYYEVPSEDHSESALMRMQKSKDGPPAPPSVPLPSWSVPDLWVEQDPGNMQRALFIVSADDQTARISVSAFPGDAGGLLANLNRWRGQIGLEPIDESGLEDLIEPITLAGGQGILTEMVNEDQALVAAITSHDGMAWFFKLDGPTSLVESQREAFLGFVRSVRF